MKITIIGASHSGISAAINLRKKLPMTQIQLLESGNGEGLSFVGADGLLWVESAIDESEMRYTTAQKIEKLGISLVLNCLVEEVDFENKIVKSNSADFEWDYLILATGSTPFLPEFAIEKIKTEPEKVQSFKTIQDAKNLKRLVDDEKIERIGVVGGGYIGVETAETLIKCGKKVSLFHSSKELMNGYFDSEFSALIANQLQKNGVELIVGNRFENFDTDEAKECDGFVFAIGFRPNSLLGGGEIKRVYDAYDVDEFQETNMKNVFAIGDCSISFNNASKTKQYLAIGSATARGASIVADVIARRAKTDHETVIVCENSQGLRSYGTAGSNALQVFGLNFASAGITLNTAEKLGIDAEAADFTGSQLANYLKPRIVGDQNHQNSTDNELGIGDIKLRVVFDKKTHRLLGGQVATFTDTVFANHLFSLAIQKECTIEELFNLDMFFLPQLNQLYNALRRCLQRVL